MEQSPTYRAILGALDITVERMKTCSPWTSAGLVLQLLAIAGMALALWYAEFVPAVPVRDTGKVMVSPRFNFEARALIVFVACTAVSASLSLIGLAVGPRTRACLLSVLPTLLVVSSPYWLPMLGSLRHAL
jgi:hypothetical protein